MDYYSRSSRRSKSYLLDPYRVVYYHGGLYLYARVEEYAEVRTFAVERISRIEVLDQGFDMPLDFDVSEYARGAFGITGGKPVPVALAFDASVAGDIRERVWHESQTIEEKPDGSLVVRLHVAAGVELRAWVKGFLPHVRVLEPASLRERIAEEIKAAVGALT
jgi:predicted DNA-binding transcriptional regulator YafY